MEAIWRPRRLPLSFRRCTAKPCDNSTHIEASLVKTNLQIRIDCQPTNVDVLNDFIVKIASLSAPFQE
jgi:hypothetical protein